MSVIGETAFFFANRRGEALFGVLLVPRTPAAHGVVFCPPYGDELVHGYRAQVEHARTLARAGFASLRFHYAGTGESEGTSHALSLASMIDDIGAAIELLKSRTRVAQVALIGARLGASVALLCARRSHETIPLVLHAPIVDGRRYLDELLAVRQVAEIARNVRPTKRAVMTQQLAEDGKLELFGDHVGRDFTEQLGALQLTQACGILTAPCAISTPAGKRYKQAARALAAALREARSTVTEWLDVECEFWTPRAANEGFVPQALHARTAAWLAAL